MASFPFSQGVKTNREVGLSVRSGNKEKTIDNDFQTTVKWNEEKIESESLGEVFAKDGNISKQGFNKEKNKYFSWRLEDEFQHFTDKFALYTNSYVSYDHAKTLSSAGTSTYRDQLINESLNQGLVKADYLYAGTKLDLKKRFSWGDAVVFTSSINVSHNKPNDTYSLNKMNYAVEGTKDVRNLYSDQHKHSYDYSFGVGYELSLSHGWSLSIPLSSYSSMRIAIIPTIVWIVWMKADLMS